MAENRRMYMVTVWKVISRNEEGERKKILKNEDSGSTLHMYI
jgi:hypothetical protein